MKATFEIEWPDDMGEGWMNTTNLLHCLVCRCPNTKFTVQRLSPMGHYKMESETAGPVNPERAERRLIAIQEAVGRGWCRDVNAQKIMDPDLALAIADEVNTAMEAF